MTNNFDKKESSQSFCQNVLDRASTVFSEPWEAQAFAIVIILSDKVYFTWEEWSNTLAENISRSRASGGPIDGSDYYLNWVTTLEQVLESKGLTDFLSLATVKAEWERAYKLTPHGKPVFLNR